jgi:cell division protein FtsB
LYNLKDEELKIERKQTEEKYEGKGRGKKLETENKELKDENRKNNNELKEVLYIITFIQVQCAYPDCMFFFVFEQNDVIYQRL